MSETFAKLHEVIEQRKAAPQEGSYTCYLFEKGPDKILKKCGEECAEMIIAAKSLDGSEEKRADLCGEVADLAYHVMVLLSALDVSPEAVAAVLDERAARIGNLKKFHVSDHNS